MIRIYDIQGVGNVDAIIISYIHSKASVLLPMSIPDDHWMISTIRWPNSRYEIGEVEMFFSCDWESKLISENCNNTIKRILGMEMKKYDWIDSFRTGKSGTPSEMNWILMNADNIIQMANPPGPPVVKFRESPSCGRLIIHDTHDRILEILDSIKFARSENPNRPISGVVAMPIKLMKIAISKQYDPFDVFVLQSDGSDRLIEKHD
jgi:hypothetical protein